MRLQTIVQLLQKNPASTVAVRLPTSMAHTLFSRSIDKITCLPVASGELLPTRPVLAPCTTICTASETQNVTTSLTWAVFAGRTTHGAINTFVGVYHQHVLARTEGVDRANVNTVGVLAADARISHDVGHSQLLSEKQERMGALSGAPVNTPYDAAPTLAKSITMAPGSRCRYLICT